MKHIAMYTDGACRGNPGKGAYAVILCYKDKRKSFVKGFRMTTNNRMELLAVIAGLEQIKSTKLSIRIYSDSKYVVDSINRGWLVRWVETDFKGGKKNKDLWTRYYQLAKKYDITIRWIKGHNEHEYNELCDAMATQTADTEAAHIDEGYESEFK